MEQVILRDFAPGILGFCVGMKAALHYVLRDDFDLTQQPVLYSNMVTGKTTLQFRRAFILPGGELQVPALG